MSQDVQVLNEAEDVSQALCVEQWSYVRRVIGGLLDPEHSLVVEALLQKKQGVEDSGI